MTTLIPKYDLKDGGSTPAGAINRPINQKLSEIISVKDFGATGDGVTDDTAAINAAIAALTATPPDSAIGGTADAPVGGTILFPNGTYVVTSTIQVHTCITLKSELISNKGQSENAYYGATIVNNVSSGPAILLYRGGAAIEGFRFLKNFATAVEHIRCISEFNRVRYCAFDSCQYAITIQNQDTNVDPTGVEIDNCEFFHQNAIWPAASIFISGATAGNIRITNNNFNLNGGITGYVGTTCIRTDQTYTPTLYIVGNNFFNATYDGTTIYPLVDLKVNGSFIAYNSFGPPLPSNPANYYGLTIAGSNNVITANTFGTWGGINVIAGTTDTEIGANYYIGVTTPVLDNGTLTDNFNQQAITFTPTLTFSGSSTGLTYTATGKYTKVRNVVTASYYIQLSAIGSASGDNVISLPITSSSGVSVSVSAGVVDYNNMSSIGNGLWCKVSPSSAVSFLQTGSSSASSRLQASNFSNSSTLQFTITYLSQ